MVRQWDISRLAALPALNLADGFWADIWARVDAEGVAETVFCDGSVQTAEDFAAEMNKPHVHPFRVYCCGKLAAVVWLTNLEGKSCRGHFVVFKEFAHYSRHIGKFMLEYLLSMKFSDGSHCFDVVIGIIPSFNFRAINLVKKSGFAYVGDIPFFIWVEKEKASASGAVFAATRSCL